jgi:hypothetical protein
MQSDTSGTSLGTYKTCQGYQLFSFALLFQAAKTLTIEPMNENRDSRCFWQLDLAPPWPIAGGGRMVQIADT